MKKTLKNLIQHLKKAARNKKKSPFRQAKSLFRKMPTYARNGLFDFVESLHLTWDGKIQAEDLYATPMIPQLIIQRI